MDSPTQQKMRLKLLYLPIILFFCMASTTWVIFLNVRFIRSRLYLKSLTNDEAFYGAVRERLQDGHFTQRQNFFGLKGLEGVGVERFQQRRGFLSYHCKHVEKGRLVRYDDINTSDLQFHDPRGQLTVCFSPAHVSRSFWGHLLRFVESATIGQKPDTAVKPDTNTSKTYIGVKAIFTQDPYARLVSVYIESLVLPQMWKTMALKINTLFGLVETEGDTVRCVSDITFVDFLRYIVYVGNEQHLRSRFSYSHWLPLSSLCQPCSTDYSFIGNMESFSEDVKFLVKILSKGALGNATSADYTREILLYSVNETINRSWLPDDELEECKVTQYEMMRRIWRAFQHLGMISPNMDLSLDNFLSLPRSELKENFRHHVVNTIQTKPVTTWQSVLGAREEITEMYRNVPEELKFKIRDMFKLDFELFGYEKEPGHIFRN